MAKKKTVTPPKEFERLADRTMTSVDFGDDVFTEDAAIEKIHEDYKLNNDKDHIVYKKVAEYLHEPIIQKNLTEYMKKIPTEEFIPDIDEAELLQEARGVYSKREERRFKKRVSEKITEGLKPKLETTGASEDDIAAVTKKIDITALPETPKFDEEIKLTKKLAEAGDRNYVVGRLRRENQFRDVLDAFYTPISTEDAAKALKGKGIKISGRDIRGMNLTGLGLTEYTMVKEGNVWKRKQRLTDKGVKMIEDGGKK